MPLHWDLPAGWRGEAFFEAPDSHYRFTEADVAEMCAAVAHARRLGRPLERLTASDFPSAVMAEQAAITARVLEHGCGACRLQGFPIDLLDAEAQRLLFWGMARHLGTPVSQSARGERLLTVGDAGLPDDHPGSRGPNTRKALAFHTDRCDVIGFLCLRQAVRGGANQLVSSVALYNEIARRRPDLLAQLQRPYPYLRHTVDTANPRPYITQPVFAACDGHFVANLLRVLIDRAAAHPDVPGPDPEQIEALDFLEAVAAEPGMAVTFRQEPGDWLYVNNWVLLHRREAFEDAADEAAKRRLLRVWLSVPDSRPLPESFRANYGDIRPGAVRGGMPSAE